MKRIIELSDEDVELLMWSLGIATSQACKNGNRQLSELLLDLAARVSAPQVANAWVPHV